MNSQFSPRIFFTAFMAFFSKFASLPFLYLITYLADILIIALASFYFTNKIFKSNLTAILTTILILYGQKITLGGNDLVGRDLDPSRPAFALVIAAFVLLTSGRYIPAAILFSVSSYLHPLIGIEAPFVFYFSLILTILLKNYKKSRHISFKNIIAVVKSGLLFLSLSGISIYSYAYAYLSKQPRITGDELFTVVSRVVAPFHYTPSTWSPVGYIKFGLFSLIFAAFFYYTSKNLSGFLRSYIGNIITTIIFLCYLGFFFTDIYHFYPVMVAQFFRLTVILYWLFAIIVYGGSFYLGIHYSKKIPLTIFLPLLPFFLANIDALMNPTKSILLYIFLSLLISVILASSKTAVKLSLVFLTVVTLAIPYRHYRFQFSSLYPFETPETKLALWVKNNTDPDSIFLTPPGFIRFRLISERAIVVDRLVTPFSEAGIYQWMERIKDVSGLTDFKTEDINEQLINDGFGKLDLKRLEYLNNKYALDFVVVEKAKQLPLEQIFTDSYFRIYRI